MNITLTFSGNTYDVNNTSGSAITINKNDGSDPSTSTGSSVTFLGSTVDLTITVKDTSGDPIENASVVTPVTSTIAGFPYQAAVTSITYSGTTATCTTTAAHGLATNDYVMIEGCTGTNDMYNGAFQITVSSTTEFTYTMGGTPSANAAGTPTVTFCFHAHLTNASGIVTDSRIVSSSQPIAYRVRKSSSSPYYIGVSGTDTVDNADGLSLSIQLVSDE